MSGDGVIYPWSRGRQDSDRIAKSGKTVRQSGLVVIQWYRRRCNGITFWEG